MTRRRRPRRAGGTLKDGERRRLARASRAGEPPPPGDDGPRVYCDGGSRGNPGPAAIAAVLVGAGGAVERRARRIGRATAAEAEYRAILLGLELAADRGLAAIDVCSDSQLALAGIRDAAPADPRLAELARSVRAGAREFSRVTWSWQPRAENGAPDELVQELLWGGAR